MQNLEKVVPVTKTALLRNMLYSNSLEFIMEAHNGLTAKLVEESGFKAIWGSGLTISSSLGVRDNNEVSWTQVLDLVEFMSDSANIPILLDGDTGYGNFNNMRRLVCKLEQRGIAGVCIEDKLFPKTNSFINGEKQPLASIEEFSGKIKAGKDSQKDDNFCIVARVEAFIAGWGLEEAMKRAEAYRLAGADAILIHSNKSDVSDIDSFVNEWCNRLPVVVVPTKYYATPTDWFRSKKISTVIWANQALRASVTAIKKTLHTINKEESIACIEGDIESIAEIFRLQGVDELARAEQMYLPIRKSNIKSFILAANAGVALSPLTVDKPKSMILVKGKPILYQLISQLNNLDIKDITVIRGYKKESIIQKNFKIIDNDDHASTKGFCSLYQAKNDLKDDCLICYGDTLFKSHLIEQIINMPGNVNIIVDSEYKSEQRIRDLVYCSENHNHDFSNTEVILKDIFTLRSEVIGNGEWVGLLFIKANAIVKLKCILEKMKMDENSNNYSLVDVIKQLMVVEDVVVSYTKGSWLDVDIFNDIESAGSF